MFKRISNLFLIICFFLTTLGLYPQAHADPILNLPAPGTMVNLSPAYEPVMIKGLTVHKDNPFLFDFIVDVGQDRMSGEPLKKQGEKLIKYFLASLAIPDKDLWVNLSPYEKNRIIPEALGQTDMGRDLLEQDYILKQITASLIYPEKQLGKTFWDKVYSKAQEMYGTTQIPVNTFNKVWIMADRAEVFEHNQTAFVVDSHLKVMLEEDYLALTKHQRQPLNAKAPQGNHRIASQIIRQIILPQLEKEVNTGKNFANLRQIFNSVILASWYKRNLKEALLNQVYADKSKVKGVMANGAKQSQEQIYEQYLKAYKKGVFNYIKEDINKASGEMIPRKYFSGGVMNLTPANFTMTANPALLAASLPKDRAMMDFATLAVSTQPEKSLQGWVEDFKNLQKQVSEINRQGQYKAEIMYRQGYRLIKFTDQNEEGTSMTFMAEYGFRIISRVIKGEETLRQEKSLQDLDTGLFFMNPFVNRLKGGRIVRNGRIIHITNDPKDRMVKIDGTTNEYRQYVPGLTRDIAGHPIHGVGRSSYDWKNLKIVPKGQGISIQGEFETSDYEGLSEALGHSKTTVTLHLEGRNLQIDTKVENMTTDADFVRDGGDEVIAEFGIHPVELISLGETTMQLPGITGVYEKDNENMPTGNILPVQGTHFDFNEPQVLHGNGYDHTFEVTPENGVVTAIMVDQKRKLKTITQMQGDLYIPPDGKGLMHIWDGADDEGPYSDIAAAEPVTNTPNASNRQGEPGGSRPLVRGETRTGSVMITIADAAMGGVTEALNSVTGSVVGKSPAATSRRHFLYSLIFTVIGVSLASKIFGGFPAPKDLDLDNVRNSFRLCKMDIENNTIINGKDDWSNFTLTGDGFSLEKEYEAGNRIAAGLLIGLRNKYQIEGPHNPFYRMANEILEKTKVTRVEDFKNIEEIDLYRSFSKELTVSGSPGSFKITGDRITPLPRGMKDYFLKLTNFTTSFSVDEPELGLFHAKITVKPEHRKKWKEGDVTINPELDQAIHEPNMKLLSIEPVHIINPTATPTLTVADFEHESQIKDLLKAIGQDFPDLVNGISGTTPLEILNFIIRYEDLNKHKPPKYRPIDVSNEVISVNQREDGSVQPQLNKQDYLAWSNRLFLEAVKSYNVPSSKILFGYDFVVKTDAAMHSTGVKRKSEQDTIIAKFIKSFDGLMGNQQDIEKLALSWGDDPDLTWPELENVLREEGINYNLARQGAVIALRAPARQAFIESNFEEVWDTVLLHALPQGIENNNIVRMNSYLTLAAIRMEKARPYLLEAMSILEWSPRVRQSIKDHMWVKLSSYASGFALETTDVNSLTREDIIRILETISKNEANLRKSVAQMLRKTEKRNLVTDQVWDLLYAHACAQVESRSGIRTSFFKTLYIVNPLKAKKTGLRRLIDPKFEPEPSVRKHNIETFLIQDDKGDYTFQGDPEVIWDLKRALLDENSNVSQAAGKVLSKLDPAQISFKTVDKAAVARGGIDLNISKGVQTVIKEGKGVEMNIDPAMKRPNYFDIGNLGNVITRVRRDGIESLLPVVLKITRVVSVWPLVGMQAPVK